MPDNHIDTCAIAMSNDDSPSPVGRERAGVRETVNFRVFIAGPLETSTGSIL